jgi:hypothetical protein
MVWSYALPELLRGFGCNGRPHILDAKEYIAADDGERRVHLRLPLDPTGTQGTLTLGNKQCAKFRYFPWRRPPDP